MHHIVSTSHIFLIGVIDLAGLFVPKQARPVGKSKTTLLSAEGFTNTNSCCSLSDLQLTCIMCVLWTVKYHCFGFLDVEWSL